MQKEQNRKIEKKEDMIVLSKFKSLEEHFMDLKSKQKRNSVISLAYLEDGYSQIEIANHLRFSKLSVFMVIKNAKSEDWTVGVFGLAIILNFLLVMIYRVKLLSFYLYPLDLQ